MRRKRRTRKPYIWPTWPVDSAIASLTEMRDRMDGYPKEGREDVHKAIHDSMNYAISVVEGINNRENPQPPSLRLVIRNAVGEFISGIASAMHSAANILEEANEWGWKRDPYD